MSLIEILPKRKSVTATSSATILEEHAVSMTNDGPFKSKMNEILLEYMAFEVAATQSAESLCTVRESSWNSGGYPSGIPIDEYPIYTPVFVPRRLWGFIPLAQNSNFRA